jgi:hypothetical protein
MSEQIQTPNIKDMDIGQLRQYASHLRVPLVKTDKKEDIIKAIERKLNGRVMPEIATKDTPLKPGYARIMLLSNPMPGADNLPVYLNCNGYVCMIPRDVEVIVPMRVVRTLTDAKVNRRKQSIAQDNYGREVFKETTVVQPSYPFQVLDINHGPEVLTALEISKEKTIGPKRRYRDMFGHWPRPRELTRAIEQGLIKLDTEEQLGPVETALLGTEDTRPEPVR